LSSPFFFISEKCGASWQFAWFSRKAALKE